LVNEENLTRLKEINVKASKANAKEGTAEQKIGDFWNTAMDSARIESLGLKPLQPYLAMSSRTSQMQTFVGNF
jgi:putative endopeptidase